VDHQLKSAETKSRCQFSRWFFHLVFEKVSLFSTLFRFFTFPGIPVVVSCTSAIVKYNCQTSILRLGSYCTYWLVESMSTETNKFMTYHDNIDRVVNQLALTTVRKSIELKFFALNRGLQVLRQMQHTCSLLVPGYPWSISHYFRHFRNQDRGEWSDASDRRLSVKEKNSTQRSTKLIPIRSGVPGNFIEEFEQYRLSKSWMKPFLSLNVMMRFHFDIGVCIT